jgi:hypothetical protein
MHKLTFAFTVLSLFTTADKAAGIERDLLEQARQRGRFWFGMHVLLISGALLVQALRADAAVKLLRGYAVYELRRARRCSRASTMQQGLQCLP